MKITFITDEASQDPKIFIELARKHALEAVELRSVSDTAVYKADLAAVRRLRDLLDDAGLRVCVLDTPIFKCSADAPLGLELEKLRHALERAHILGSARLRIFTYWRPAPSTTITESLERAHEIVHGSETMLLVENGKRTNHRTGGELADLLASQCRKCFAALWDPGNALLSGAESDPVSGGYERLRGAIAHVHIKDPKIDGGERRYVALGEGGLRIREQVRRLHADGYDGFLSLETHWRADGRVLTESLMDTPYGLEFSSGGYQATSASLETLSAWMNHEKAAAP